MEWDVDDGTFTSTVVDNARVSQIVQPTTIFTVTVDSNSTRTHAVHMTPMGTHIVHKNS